MVDTFEVIAGALEIVSLWDLEALKMSRGKTVPSTRKHSRSSPSGRLELIARKKDEKQSAKKRTVLDDHFYRTDLGFSRAVPPRAEADARHVSPNEARKRRASERHRVGC